MESIHFNVCGNEEREGRRPLHTARKSPAIVETAAGRVGAGPLCAFATSRETYLLLRDAAPAACLMTADRYAI